MRNGRAASAVAGLPAARMGTISAWSKADFRVSSVGHHGSGGGVPGSNRPYYSASM
jgi:hypothetical protein